MAHFLLLVDGTSHLGRCHKSLEEVFDSFMPYFEETSILKKVVHILFMIERIFHLREPHMHLMRVFTWPLHGLRRRFHLGE